MLPLYQTPGPGFVRPNDIGGDRVLNIELPCFFATGGGATPAGEIPGIPGGATIPGVSPTVPTVPTETPPAAPFPPRVSRGALPKDRREYAEDDVELPP